MEDMREFIQKELLYAFETSYNKARLYDMAERYGFLDKLEIFSEIVRSTLYGNTPVTSLSATLKTELGVSHEVAEYINIEVDRELFSEVRAEFNVAQGLTSIEQYEKELREYAEKEGLVDREDTVAIQTPKEESAPPIDTSAPTTPPIEKSAPKATRDPYREPIDD